MKNRNRLACLLSLLLIVSLLLSGCIGPGAFPAIPIDSIVPSSEHLETKPPVLTEAL